MTTLVLTDPVNGTVADANTIASNNTAVKGVVNGNIDNANMAAAAAVAVTKLATGGAGQVLGTLAGVNTWLGGLGQIVDSTAGGSVASFDLTSIPATYGHLLLVGYFRGDTAATTTTIGLRLNNDSTGVYYSEEMAVSAATVSAGELLAGTSITVNGCPANTAGANRFGCSMILLPHYTNSANHKSVLGLNHMAFNNTSGNIQLRFNGGTWSATAAVTRITLIPGAGNFVAGSRVTLYGLG